MFQKGNSGKPKGAINKQNQVWEDLKDAIIDRHAGRFNQILGDLLESRDQEERERGAEMFMKVLEYFKPKYSRVTHAGDQDAPVKITISNDI